MDRAPPPTRADYPVLYDIPTRWLDNDIYGHVNNVNYYSYFDTAIAHFLMGEGGLDPWRDPIVGFCVESGEIFARPSAGGLNKLLAWLAHHPPATPAPPPPAGPDGDGLAVAGTFG